MGEVCKLMRMVLMGNFKKALQEAPYADTAVMEQWVLPASHTQQFARYKRKGLQKAAGLMCSPHIASAIVILRHVWPTCMRGLTLFCSFICYKASWGLGKSKTGLQFGPELETFAGEFSSVQAPLLQSSTGKTGRSLFHMESCRERAGVMLVSTALCIWKRSGFILNQNFNWLIFNHAAHLEKITFLLDWLL